MPHLCKKSIPNTTPITTFSYQMLGLFLNCSCSYCWNIDGEDKIDVDEVDEVGEVEVEVEVEVEMELEDPLPSTFLMNACRSPFGMYDKYTTPYLGLNP
jgi:hypothetical protein